MHPGFADREYICRLRYLNGNEVVIQRKLCGRAVENPPFQVKLCEENSLMQLPRAFDVAHRAMGDRLRIESNASPIALPPLAEMI
jgi:hypothetical protein